MSQNPFNFFFLDFFLFIFFFFSFFSIIFSKKLLSRVCHVFACMGWSLMFSAVQKISTGEKNKRISTQVESRKKKGKNVEIRGVEPRASRSSEIRKFELRSERSTTELHPPPRWGGWKFCYINATYTFVTDQLFAEQSHLKESEMENDIYDYWVKIALAVVLQVNFIVSFSRTKPKLSYIENKILRSIFQLILSLRRG